MKTLRVRLRDLELVLPSLATIKATCGGAAHQLPPQLPLQQLQPASHNAAATRPGSPGSWQRGAASQLLLLLFFCVSRLGDCVYACV